MQAHSRDASHPGKNNKDTAGGSDEKPVPDATGIHRLIRSPAAVQAAFNVVSSNAVAAGFGAAASFQRACSSPEAEENATAATPRSEERRVGKKSRARGGPGSSAEKIRQLRNEVHD